MAEAQPTDNVRTICSMVGSSNSGPITAVMSTIMVPEVRIVWILPLYAAISASLTGSFARISR